MTPLVRHYVAYIDPGTGSMLFTLLIGLLSAGYFFFKRVLIKFKFLLAGGRSVAADQTKMPYVIFAESKRYWNVFQPICDEFERRGIPVEYWTTSEDDPSLTRGYTYVHPTYVGQENRAFARLNLMSATVCLSTTPGLDVYQWKRSKDVDWYVHTFHTVGTSVGYRMFGIDYYDAVLMGGRFMEYEIRTLEHKRNLPPKELELVGVTYMDEMRKRFENSPAVHGNRRTVLLAPTWGPSGILRVYGRRILQALVNTGYQIIVRPHPQSKTSDADVLDALMAEFPNGDSLQWNFDNDNFEVLRRSDIMISDFSGVIFDYSLIFDRPVIYTEGNFDDAIYDACWLDEPQWRFSLFPKLGVPLQESQFPRMKEVIDTVIVDERLRAGREQARRDAWAYQGEAAQRTVDYLVSKYAELAGDSADKQALGQVPVRNTWVPPMEYDESESPAGHTSEFMLAAESTSGRRTGRRRRKRIATAEADNSALTKRRDGRPRHGSPQDAFAPQETTASQKATDVEPEEEFELFAPEPDTPEEQDAATTDSSFTPRTAAEVLGLKRQEPAPADLAEETTQPSESAEAAEEPDDSTTDAGDEDHSQDSRRFVAISVDQFASDDDAPVYFPH